MQHASDTSIEFLRALVGFDTTSQRSNMKLIEFVSEYLSDCGVACSRVVGDDDKSNLFATIGHSNEPGVILSGHTDVVPVAGQDWASDPFDLRIENGRAFGRGTCDMKGFLASVLAAVPKFVAADLKCPIHLAFSYDEEIGCVGVRELVRAINDRGIRALACIVGEPSSMQPVAAHTGKQIYRCKFIGTPMHSSLAPQAVNAISFAGEVIQRINQIAEDVAHEKTADTRFTTPFPTTNIGVIKGGKAVNIIAGACEFDVEYRYPPGAPATYFEDRLSKTVNEHIKARMRKVSDSTDASCQMITSYPAFRARDDSPAVELVKRITGANRTLAVSYGTEAGIYEDSGFPSIVCGPGNIEQAHTPNEFIELSQLAACDAFLDRLVEELSTGKPT